MLKIKDDVDLKELEKFGFKKYEQHDSYYKKSIQVTDGYQTFFERLEIEINDRIIRTILYNDLSDQYWEGTIERVGRIFDIYQARISGKNRRKEVIGEMGEREYNLWLVLLVILKNSIAITCFTILAITFNIWWIALFSILFMSSVESEKEDK